MPNDLSMIFNVIARDGASPAFRTVAAEAKALQAAVTEADAKMTASTRAASAEIDRSLASLGRAHSETALQYDRAAAQEIGANDSLEASSAKLSASLQGLVQEQRAAAAASVEAGASIDRAAAEQDAATTASLERRKAAFMSFGLVAAGALGVIGYESVKAATSFESSMARVQTLAGASSSELHTLSGAILNLAPKVGVGPDALAESLYHVESAGFRGAKALDLVTASAKLSALGQDDINASTQAVIATLASNIKGVRDANDAAALIVHTVGVGDTTLAQFTHALGTGLLPTAAAVGLSFQQVGAAIATLTDNAIPADQAANKLRGTLLALEKPSGPGVAALQSIGLNAQSLANDLRGPDGLKGALDDLRVHLDKTFPPNGGAPLSITAQRAAVAQYRGELVAASVSGAELDKAVNKYSDSLKHGTSNTVLQTQTLSSLFGGSRQAGTALVLYGEQLDRFNPKLASFGDANTRAAQLQAAWAKQQDTFKQKLNELSAAFDVMKIKIGNALLPVLKDVVGFLGSHIGLLQAFAFAIGTTLVAATVAWTIALQANPVVLFVEALVLVGVEIYELITHFKEFVAFLRGSWGTAISAAIATILPFVGIPLLIIGHWQQLLGFFKKLWSDISSASGWADLGKNILHAIGDIPGLIGKAFGKAFDFGQILGHAWGRLIADVPHWIGDLISALTHVDWAHVAAVVGEALINGIKAIWRNKGKIAEVGLAIIAGIAVAVFAIPAALTAIGVGIVAGLVVGIVKGLSGAAGAVGRFFERMWHDAAGFAARMWHDVAGFFGRINHDIAHAIGDVVNFVSVHWRLLIVIFTGPIGFVIDLVNKFWKQISGFFARLWHDVSGFAARIWHDVTGWIARMWHDAAGWVARMWNDVTGWFARIWRDVSGFAARIWHDVFGWFERIWHDVFGWVARIWSDVTGWFSRIWHDVSGFAARIWGDVTGWFSRLWHDLTDIATRLWHDVTSPFQHLWDGLKLGFNDVVDGIRTAWNKLGEIFAAPIRFLVHYVYDDAIVKVWNAVMGVVGEKGTLNPVDFNAIHFATGGVIPGNHDRDTVPFFGTPGEVVVPKPVVKNYGGPESLMSMLGFDGQGGGAGSHLFGGGPIKRLGERLGHDITHNPVTNALGSGVKAVGGALGDVGSAAAGALGDVAGKLGGLVRGALADTTGPILDGAINLLGKLIPGNTPVEKTALDLGHGMVDAITTWIRGQDAKDQAALSGGLLGGEPISWNGGPFTVGLIEALARTLPFGNIMQVTSTTGGGHAGGSYHYKGEAVDFSNGFGNTPQMLAFDQAWASKYGSSLAELIYTAPGSVFVKDGRGVPGSFYSGVLGEHVNHVHVAISPESIARGHDAFNAFKAGGGGLAAGGLRAEVEAAAAARGWGGQFGALDYIIGHESSWNPNARNPGSTASGLFQLLYGGTGSVQQQITNGFNYIAGRYGDPNNAQRFWASHHWYGNGGTPPIGEMIGVGENGPELLRLGPSLRGSRIYSNEQSKKLAGSGGQNGLHFHGPTYINDGVDLELKLKQHDFWQQQTGGF